MLERVHGIVSRDVLTAEPGLMFLRSMLEGRHPAPPFSRSTNVYMTQVDEGRVIFEGEPTEAFFNPLGTIHGGWTSAILDSAMACAVHTTLAAGQGYTTVEMKLNFVRPILPNMGKVTCEGTLIHRGGTLATSEGKLFDAKGRLLAHGTETCMIFDATARKAA
ncbi:PaaI family thioesterase [Microvirga sp. CF3062]|uniref:PaaI family thioesterase n=1 Tax=Microvirga sp. CF3062 TaxID=3110182 RepID=UPI002E773BBA|nr:PaaI family thioesterase [Microvirga sp. CF3062]MEE1657330.1 PaaI family thioesterase [Microvirga sp. CF3062]